MAPRSFEHSRVWRWRRVCEHSRHARREHRSRSRSRNWRCYRRARRAPGIQDIQGTSRNRYIWRLWGAWKEKMKKDWRVTWNCPSQGCETCDSHSLRREIDGKWWKHMCDCSVFWLRKYGAGQWEIGESMGNSLKNCHVRNPKCWISDAFSGPPACSGYLGVLRPSKRTPHELLEDDWKWRLGASQGQKTPPNAVAKHSLRHSQFAQLNVTLSNQEWSTTTLWPHSSRSLQLALPWNHSRGGFALGSKEYFDSSIVS